MFRAPACTCPFHLTQYHVSPSETALHHRLQMFICGRLGPSPINKSTPVCIREWQDVDAMCFLWDLTGSSATLSLTALNETSASHAVTWVEFIFHHRLPISVHYKRENTAGALGVLTPSYLPPHDVISCPVQALLTCWWSTRVSAEGVLKVRREAAGCFLSEVGPRHSWANVSRAAQRWWVFDTQERWSVVLTRWVTFPVWCGRTCTEPWPQPHPTPLGWTQHQLRARLKPEDWRLL